MDKDRIAGAANQLKGTLKTTVGKMIGDAKLVTDGKTDTAKGKIQNAVGSIKDTLRGT